MLSVITFQPMLKTPLRRCFSTAAAVAAGNKVPVATTNPLESPDYFNLRDVVTVKELFQARAHLGHRSNLRNPYMIPYIYGTRQGIDILDLDQTHSLLLDALNFTAHIAYRKGIILFMGQNQQVK